MNPVKSSWHLDRVVIINKATRHRYDFVCGQWLASDKNKDGKQVLMRAFARCVSHSQSFYVDLSSLSITLRAFKLSTILGIHARSV